MATGFPDYLSGFQQPSALYVAAGDVLRVTAASNQAAETITVNYRIWQSNRGVKKGQFTISPNSSRVVTTKDEVMVEGFLISLSCKASAATTRGQTFVRAFLTDSTFGLGQPSAMLMSDYVTTQAAPGHPNGRVLSPSEGPGWSRTLAIANPAAGADWTTTVPANARWRLHSVAGIFSPGAVNVNRWPGISTDNPVGTTLLKQWPGQIIGTGQVCVFNALQGVGYYSSGVTGGGVISITFGLPNDLILLAGGTVYSVTLNIDPGDQWTAVYISFEEWLDNA